MGAPAVSRAWVDEAVDALVREFSPLKIFLFGSRARGDGREESDIDLLVVLERIDDRRKTRDALQKALPPMPVWVDVFVADSDELARTGDSVGSFVYPVLREGNLRRLSTRAVVPRYPGDVPDTTADEAREEVALARAIVDAARADIGASG